MKFYNPRPKVRKPWYGPSGYGMETANPYTEITEPLTNSIDPVTNLGEGPKGFVVQGLELPDNATSPKQSSKLPYLILYGAIAFFLFKKFNARPR